MEKIKLYRKVILFQIGTLISMITHIVVTQNRGYKAIGGEFLLIPLVYILCSILGQVVSFRDEVK